jgi:hypothetical protein
MKGDESRPFLLTGAVPAKERLELPGSMPDNRISAIRTFVHTGNAPGRFVP